MDKQELLNEWEQTEEKERFPKLPEGTEQYIAEGGERPDLQSVAKSIYLYDLPKKIIAALDTDQELVAARMLRVTGELRRRGLIGGEEEDPTMIRVCKLTGEPFSFVLEQVISGLRDYVLEYSYYAAQALAKYYPEETKRFADLAPRQAPAAEDDETEQARCLLRVLCCIGLAEQNAALCADYAPKALAGLDSLPLKARAQALHFAYPLSDALKARAAKEAKSDYTALYEITRASYRGNEKKAEILKEIGIPEYAHILKARGNDSTESIGRYFLDLYRTKPEEVHWACRTLLEYKIVNAHAAGIPIAAMLCHFQDGKEELPLAEACMFAIMDTYSTPFRRKDSSSAWELLRDCTDGKLSYEELKAQVTAPDRIVGRGYPVFEALGALSLYSERAAKLLHLCISLCVDQDEKLGLLHFYLAALVGAMFWCECPESDAVNKLLKLGCPREMVYYAYLYITWQYAGRNYATETPVKELLQENPQDATAFLAHPWLDEPDPTVIWLDLIYGELTERDCAPLCRLMANKSKKIRAACTALLAEREADARPILEKQLPGMKGEPAKQVKKLLRTWDNERKFGKDFALSSNEVTAEFAKENLDTDNMSLIAWIPQEMLQGVRFADLSAPAPAECLQFILVEYMGMTEPGRVSLCDKVAERLSASDLSDKLGEIFELWNANGAEAKKKNILLPYCIYGSESQIIGMRRRMETWADASRGALAAFAAQAVALNGGSSALMMIDAISVKFPNNQVKNAAKAAFSFAAEALGVPEDVLSDKIVPTLGFSQAGKKTLDYGARTFTVTLLPDFSLEITDDEKGKAVKSLPKPAASDDAVKAEAARKEFTELKKQLKATAAAQKNRLEKVLQNGRTWDAAAWDTLFAQNPVMHRFATGLVWGNYAGGRLTDTFRYLEDGSFTTADEDTYEIPSDARISLVHPCDLTAEQLAVWKQQLADYEVTQPLAQLDAPIAELNEGDVKDNALVRYDGKASTVAKMTAFAKKYGMQRGEVLDAGSYTCFYWQDDYLKAGVQVNFEYMYMGQEYTEEVPLHAFIFYRLPLEDVRTDEIPEKCRIDPRTLPKRYLCSVLSAMDALTADA